MTSQIDRKGLITIVRISREEAEMIRERFPNVHVRVTCQRAPSRKHTYYCEEVRRVMTFLAQQRAGARNG